jgi:cytochrome bd-type quinol oxidase subunit 2
MGARTKVAIIAVAVLVAVVYVFSLTPYLLNRDRQGLQPSVEIAIPAISLVLILVLVLLVPRRKREDHELTQEKEEQEREKEKKQEYKARDMAEYRFRKKSLLSGALAGFIAAWVLVGLIFAGDMVLGFPSGTLYSIIGLTMAGLGMPYALYFGIGMHLVTGTLIGTVFGYITAIVGAFNITSLGKGTLVGILAGFISFSLLFIPITRFQVEQSLIGFLASIHPPGIDQIILQNKALDIASTVLAGAVPFHIIYGAIMGFITGYLLLVRGSHKKEEEKKTF